MTTLDHFILEVHDLDASMAFYTDVLGFTVEGKDGPFTVIRVNAGLVMLLISHAPQGPAHYAFAMSRQAFEAAFDRIKTAGIAYGPSFNTVGSKVGPGMEFGACGLAPALYFNDPSGHLLEIRYYDA